MTVEVCQIVLTPETTKGKFGRTKETGYSVWEAKKLGPNGVEVIESIRFKNLRLEIDRDWGINANKYAKLKVKEHETNRQMLLHLIAKLMEDGWEPLASSLGGTVTSMKRIT